MLLGPEILLSPLYNYVKLWASFIFCKKGRTWVLFNQPTRIASMPLLRHSVKAITGSRAKWRRLHMMFLMTCAVMA